MIKSLLRSSTHCPKRITVVHTARRIRWSSWRSPPRRATFRPSLDLIMVAGVCAMCVALLRASRNDASKVQTPRLALNP